MFLEYMFTLSQYTVILLSVIILFRCLRSMLSETAEPEIWAYVRAGRDAIPVFHWENIIGRARSCDVRVFGRGIGRTHAILSRNGAGLWTVTDVFSKGGVWVNGERARSGGAVVRHGDIINLGGSCVRFLDISEEQRAENEKQRTSAGRHVSPELTLIDLTLVQLCLLFQHRLTAAPKDMRFILLSYAALMALEWALYEGMRLVDKSGFEIEILAFYLTTMGLCVSAGAAPEDVYKHILLVIVSVIMFLICGWWLRSLRRAKAFRIPLAALALALLALNILTSDPVNGAKSWLKVFGFSFQPSEFVKAFYIYVGAASLESLYKRRNLYSFIVFSALCVVALALIGDFGTAVIFFATFLVISFMRSGSIATVLLAVTGAALAGFLAVSVKPYIARRFQIWGHAWEDIYDAGYQQTRAMSAAASGGLVGKGAGGGWLKGIVYSDTDMVFAYVCEELGLAVSVCMVLSVILIACFAVKGARNGRSSYYAIAACAASSLLLVQLALNVFGSLDILPFTGVTFPFVSRGGSSLISCWMLMAFFKSSDNRRDASFAVEKGEILDTHSEMLRMMRTGGDGERASSEKPGRRRRGASQRRAKNEAGQASASKETASGGSEFSCKAKDAEPAAIENEDRSVKNKKAAKRKSRGKTAREDDE